MTKKVIPIKIESECEDKLTGFNKCGDDTHTIATTTNAPEWNSTVTEGCTESDTDEVCDNPYNKLLHGSDKECVYGKCECNEAEDKSTQDKCLEDRYASAYPNKDEYDDYELLDGEYDEFDKSVARSFPIDDCEFDDDEDDDDIDVNHDDIHKFNVGNSNYSQHKIQPWDIWEEYDLNPWEADIVKRVLREKYEPGMSYVDSRIMDFKKIIHVARKCIELLEKQKKLSPLPF